MSSDTTDRLVRMLQESLSMDREAFLLAIMLIDQGRAEEAKQVLIERLPLSTQERITRKGKPND